jgi:hypothetical protein
VDIFPNPSDGLLNINFDDVYTNNMNMTISDLSGRSIYLHVLTGINNQIDLSDLQKGMYIIQLNAGDEILRTPIIIK